MWSMVRDICGGGRETIVVNGRVIPGREAHFPMVRTSAYSVRNSLDWISQQRRDGPLEI